MSKRSYHTDLILQLQLNLLPSETLREIPSSTLHNWKNRNINTLFGMEQVLSDERISTLKTIASSKKLLIAGKAMCHVYFTLKKILTQARAVKKLFRENAGLIVETISRIEPQLGFKRALRLFNISSRKFHSWKNKLTCKTSIFERCRKKHPLQLTNKETEIIKNYILDPAMLHWPNISVYWKMIRDGVVYMSPQTFSKYAGKFFAERKQCKIKKAKQKKGIRAVMPFEILHMDVTVFRTLDHTKIYLFIIMDNFSRAILGWKASLNCKAETACANLREVCTKYKLWNKNVKLITDDGPENKGEVNQFLLSPRVTINKQVAQTTNFTFSNSMVEAINKQLKYQYLFTRNLPNFKAAVEYLEIALPDFMNRPHYALHGFTPQEVLSGITPDKHAFSKPIQNAKQFRISENQKTNCSTCLNPN